MAFSPDSFRILEFSKPPASRQARHPAGVKGESPTCYWVTIWGFRMLFFFSALTDYLRSAVVCTATTVASQAEV